MDKLPRLTAREICSVLEKPGFSIARQSGSRMIYKNAEGKRATVPFHAASSSSQDPEKHHAGCRLECRRPGKTALTRLSLKFPLTTRSLLWYITPVK